MKGTTKEITEDLEEYSHKLLKFLIVSVITALFVWSGWYPLAVLFGLFSLGLIIEMSTDRIVSAIREKK